MLQLTSTPQPQAAALVHPERLQRLDDEHEPEVLAFLAARPLHTFVMNGWIRDNGLVSPLNRGSFYGWRNDEEILEGVALIGHITVFETNSDAALAAFARLTQTNSATHAIMGEAGKVERFLSHYKGLEPRLRCREYLFEQRRIEPLDGPVMGLRLATIADLELVAPIHAQLALEESGVNPLFVDPEGFYLRCIRRIQQKRVWVQVQEEQLSFKADIISDTPEVTYLEGVYVSPEERGNGHGRRCLKQLTAELLAHTKSVCLLVNHKNPSAYACYQKAGYQMRELYDTVYLSHDQARPIH